MGACRALPPGAKCTAHHNKRGFFAEAGGQMVVGEGCLSLSATHSGFQVSFFLKTLLLENP